MVGGSCSDTIGFFCFNPWMLKMAGAAKDLIRVEDFSSDAVVMRLASASTTRKLILLDSYDGGNKAVTVVSLVFVGVRSFAINYRTPGCKKREIYSCSLLLWILSFHRQASTILFNKLNMVLETFATLFLVT